ncbi:putative membrane protein [Colletotrichum sidae]|uniref:Putative membrane protein n=1 Tax=Colletotrichum sidae TaxID=1347389 RepID=A0A4R8TT87_9PEZI|nr:putative membrane protein [Colletotrichum sidae]
MRLTAVACGILACFVSQVAATALTYKIHANEKACFYAKTQKENEKVAFYFAVQSGGSFDIDYIVTGPGNKVILDGAKERQGDFVFTAQQVGDYEFCFNNEMSTFAEKFVDFEIAVENEVRAQLPSKQGASAEQHTTLEETIFKLSGSLSTISRGQKYFRTRENRNFSTVRSTEARIINFSMIQYDSVTGERYSPTWAESKDVTSKAIFDWKQKQKAEEPAEVATRTPEPESHCTDDKTEEGAPSQGLAGDSLDSSQPIQPPHRRKRHRSKDVSQFGDWEEDQLPLAKRHCSEVSSVNVSEVDTDAASDILTPSPSFFVGLPSKLEFDPSEYLSVSASQGSASFGSQPISTVEDEDDQVFVTEGLSQKTIPDSQDYYSAFESQDLLHPVPQSGPRPETRTETKADAGSEVEISDSQKYSSLGTLASKTADSQARQPDTGDFGSQTQAQGSSLPDHFESSQDLSEVADQVPLTHNVFFQSQQPIVACNPSITPAAPSAVVQRARSSSENSLSLAAQAAAQLVQEQDSVPATLSDKSIPSYQVNELPVNNEASQLYSIDKSSRAVVPQESASSETPVFLTQPLFHFGTSSSESISAKGQTSPGISGATNQQSRQTKDAESGPEGLVVVSDSQENSLDNQHAQVVAPLPNICASQVGSSYSFADDDTVPETVRRPGIRRLSLASLEPSSGASSRKVASSPSNQLPTTSQPDRRASSQLESLHTCDARQSLPPHSTEVTGVQPNRSASNPAAMDPGDGEPLSALDELLRLQEAALRGVYDRAPTPSPVRDVGQLDHAIPSLVENNEHAFSAPTESPVALINSQPPISTNWGLVEGATLSTDLPVLTSAPVGPTVDVAVEQQPQTANMGDIFPSNLMPPDPAEQLPMTISPSDVSRSIEADEGMTGVDQQNDQPLIIQPTEAFTARKSTATSPDVEDQYRSGPPTAMDQREYLVTLPLPANTRPLYLSTISVYKREIEQFNMELRSGDVEPEKALVDAIGRLMDQLRDICDLPANLDGASIDALSAVDLKKHAMGTNSKYFFVGHFLERLQTSHKKILIIVRDINIMGYLEAVIGTGDMAYTLKGLHELESKDEHSLNVMLLHTQESLVDDLSDFDVVIGFDNGIMRTNILNQWTQMKGKKPMLIRLMTTYSIEHLEPMMPPDLDDLERKNALLIALFQSRSLIASDEQGEVLDEVATLFANQVIEPMPSFGWNPVLIPTAVLDFFSSSQHDSQLPPTAEELTSRKRKADDGSVEATKRLRLSLSPKAGEGAIDDAVRSTLNPKASHVEVRTTQDHLDSLNTKVTELEFQLTDKTDLESNLRKHITNLSKRVKSHDKTINIIQERHMAALRERSQFEAERDEARQREEKAWEQSRAWQAKAESLEEELRKKSATLEEALVNAGSVASDVFKQRAEELGKAEAKIAELGKKLASRDGELNYAREAYQNANHTNTELTRENNEFRRQVEEFHKQAAGSLAQIQNINAGEQVKDMQRQIAETQAITRDREKELARVEKELRALKNGRRETRQQSVPRSPRLGMMSPRAPRTAAGSASRGTSPAQESGSGTPIGGPQIFSTPASVRWGHLRD